MTRFSKFSAQTALATILSVAAGSAGAQETQPMSHGEKIVNLPLTDKAVFCLTEALRDALPLQNKNGTLAQKENRRFNGSYTRDYYISGGEMQGQELYTATTRVGFVVNLKGLFFIGTLVEKAQANAENEIRALSIAGLTAAFDNEASKAMAAQTQKSEVDLHRAVYQCVYGRVPGDYQYPYKPGEYSIVEPK